jgi:hypothetical protein
MLDCSRGIATALATPLLPGNLRPMPPLGAPLPQAARAREWDRLLPPLRSS